jgi:hypothetical protein
MDPITKPGVILQQFVTCLLAVLPDEQDCPFRLVIQQRRNDCAQCDAYRSTARAEVSDQVSAGRRISSPYSLAAARLLVDRYVADNRQPGEWDRPAESIRPATFFPCGDRGPHAACGSQNRCQHHPMSDGQSAAPQTVLMQGEVRLMKHYLDVVFVSKRPVPDPKAERQVCRPKTEGVGHPLHKDSPRLWKFVEHAAGSEQVERRHGAQFTVDDHSGIFKARCITARAPYMNDIAGGSKS